MKPLVALALLASTAHADPMVPGEREAAESFATTVDFEHRIRWQSELAMFVGAAPIDRVETSTSPAYSLATGIHRDRLTLLAEYALASISYRGPSTSTSTMGGTNDTETSGFLHRFGATARYSFVKTGADLSTGSWSSELWLEGGIGGQIARWDNGGTFARPDVVFGIGIQEARRESARTRVGLFAALRFEVGRRTDVDYAPATCSAPCTEPSQPAAWSDRSVLLHVGFLFGD